MRRRPKKINVGDVLFGRNRGKALALLFANPDAEYYLRQIAAAIGVQPGTIAPELSLLDDLELLISRRVGNLLFYKVNRQSPIFSELQSLVAKTVGIFHLLGSALKNVAASIDFAFVYGSFAKREERAGSDIDLLVVGKVELENVLAALQPIENQILRPINPTVYSRKEFKANLASGNYFISTITRGPKVFVVGDGSVFATTVAPVPSLTTNTQRKGPRKAR